MSIWGLHWNRGYLSIPSRACSCVGAPHARFSTCICWARVAFSTRCSSYFARRRSLSEGCVATYMICTVRSAEEQGTTTACVCSESESRTKKSVSAAWEETTQISGTAVFWRGDNRGRFTEVLCLHECVPHAWYFLLLFDDACAWPACGVHRGLHFPSSPPISSLPTPPSPLRPPFNHKGTK